MGTRTLKAGAALHSALVPKTSADSASSTFVNSSEIKKTMLEAVETTKKTFDSFSAYGITQINNPNFVTAKLTVDTLEAFVNPQKGHSRSTSKLKTEAKQVCDGKIANVKSMLTSTGGSLLTVGSNFADVMQALRDEIQLSKDKVDKNAKKFKEYGEQLSEEDKKLSDAIKRKAQGGVYGLVNTLQNTSPDKRINSMINKIEKNVYNNLFELQDTLVNMEGNRLFLSQAIPLLKFLEGKAPAAQKVQAVVDFSNGTYLANSKVEKKEVEELNSYLDNMTKGGWAKEQLEQMVDDPWAPAPASSKRGSLSASKIAQIPLRKKLERMLVELDKGNGTTDDLVNLWREMNEIWISASAFTPLEKARLIAEGRKVTDVLGMKAMSRRELAMTIVANESQFKSVIGKGSFDFVKDYAKKMDNVQGYYDPYDYIWGKLEKKIHKSYIEYINYLRKQQKLPPILAPP